MKNKKINTIVISMLVWALLFSALPIFIQNASADDPTLDPHTIPKYVQQLIVPPVYKPTIIKYPNGQIKRYEYTVNVSQFYEQILPTTDAYGNPTGFGMTKVWGYGGVVKKIPGTNVSGYFRYSPGATFEEIRGIPARVKWINDLVDSNGNPLPHLFAVDPTVSWANPNNMVIPTAPFLPYPSGYAEAQAPVPITVHVHGAEVQSTSDGAPNTWFTPNGIHGMDYYSRVPTQPNAAVYEYPNRQLPATIWYHDHALGLDRLNVMAGLAGFYIIRDNCDPVASHLPSGKYEIPIAIQDRSFNADGSFWYPSEGVNPDIHPYWIPEFFGNAIMVNGQTWPNLNVEPRQYRFRLLEGSNARFYTFSFWDQNTGRVLPFTQIGGDGSYLPNPVTTTELTFAPGERLDIVVDFTGIPVGHKIIMQNTANSPFPDGDPIDPDTTGQIMQFTVVPKQGTVYHKTIPDKLIDMKMLVPDTPPAIHTLYEVQGPNGPQEVLLDGQSMMAPVSEMPRVGSTQDWIFVDTTMDTHPMHMHLVQFQLIKRQTFDSMEYSMDWIEANGGEEPPFTNPTVNINIDDYLTGSPIAPQPNELGWKDTIKVYPGEIAQVRVRWAPLDAKVTGPYAPHPGLNLYPFDPTVGPGYMWHCHILEHEENDMMRMYMVMP